MAVEATLAATAPAVTFSKSLRLSALSLTYFTLTGWYISNFAH